MKKILIFTSVIAFAIMLSLSINTSINSTDFSVIGFTALASGNTSGPGGDSGGNGVQCNGQSCVYGYSCDRWICYDVCVFNNSSYGRCDMDYSGLIVSCVNRRCTIPFS